MIFYFCPSYETRTLGMVYELVRDNKGRHLALSCRGMIEVMVGYTGFKLTKGEKSRLEDTFGQKYGSIKLDFSGCSQQFWSIVVIVWALL